MTMETDNPKHTISDPPVQSTDDITENGEKRQLDDVTGLPPKRPRTEDKNDVEILADVVPPENGSVTNDENSMEAGPTEDNNDFDKEEMEDTKDRNEESNENDMKSAQQDEKAQDDPQEKPEENGSKKHVRSKNVDPKVLEIRRRIQIGCRDNDLAAAMAAYEEALKNDTRLEAQSFYNLLNLCDGLERTVHIGTPKATTNGNDNKNGEGTNVVSKSENESQSRPSSPQIEQIDAATRQAYAFRIKDHMARLDLPLNETAYTAIVKILSRTKEFEKAETVLDEAEKVQQCRPKLRLYSSLLVAYCDDNKMEDALRAWRRLARQGLQISEKESLALMRCAFATGDRNVMQAVLTDLADEVAVPSKDTVATILEWFASPHATHKESLAPIHADDSNVKKLLREIHSVNGGAAAPVTSMGPVVDTKGWRISSAVKIDTQTGMLLSGCLKGCGLKPVPLSDGAWKEMSEMNSTIVMEGQVSGSKSEFAGGKKGKKKMNFSPEKRREEWKKFNDFLDARSQPVDVVIDGANVGYFKQNFGNAPKHVDYNQIDWIVQHFAEAGKRVLLVIHERHFARNLMPDKFKPLQEKWEKEGVLYKTPPGMNDDWFWLHASLKFKSLVLTNDEMRDHHFQMLAPRIFLRWKERHQIHFEFGEWQEGNNNRKVELAYPPVYSRRIQRVEDGLVVPLAKRGDENRFLDGVHVASDDEPIEETYLCIRPEKVAKPIKAAAKVVPAIPPS